MTEPLNSSPMLPLRDFDEPPADRPHFKRWPKRLPRHLTTPDTSLWFNLEVSAMRYPTKPLYLFFGRPHTFAEVRDEALAVAGWLQSVGVQAGDRVLVCMQNTPQYAAAFYGIVRANAVPVPVNPMNKALELAHYITDPQAKVAICTSDVAPAVAEASAGLAEVDRLHHVLVARYADAMPAVEAIDPADAGSAALQAWLRADVPLASGHTRWTDAVAQRLRPGPHTAQADDLAMLPYTSGTTGNPKGCMHTHRTLGHNVFVSGIWGCSTSETVSLGVVPIFHITGMMYNLHAPIATGATVVLMPRWDRELAGRLISRHRVTHWTCIPTMVMDLFGSPNYASFDLSSLRFMSGGGAAMPQAVAERLRAQYGIDFAEGYGLTETSAPTHANPPEAPKLQCLGIPIIGVDSRVVNPDTLEELPVGEVGEIIVHGPQIFRGYWRNPEATAAAFIEFEGRSFFRTGDLGQMDEEGYFFITDRLKRMINASGFKVWPAEVEMLLYKHPAVLEACIIGTRDAYRGETVKAFVVLRPEARGTATTDDIVNWSRDHMAVYKVPRIVEFVDALPKSGSGKVMWRALQDAEAQQA